MNSNMYIWAREQGSKKKILSCKRFLSYLGFCSKDNQSLMSLCHHDIFTRSENCPRTFWPLKRTRCRVETHRELITWVILCVNRPTRVMTRCVSVAANPPVSSQPNYLHWRRHNEQKTQYAWRKILTSSKVYNCQPHIGYQFETTIGPIVCSVKTNSKFWSSTF